MALAETRTLADFFDQTDDIALLLYGVERGKAFDPRDENPIRARVIANVDTNKVANPLTQLTGGTVTFVTQSSEDMNRLEGQSASIRLRASFIGGSSSLSAGQRKLLREQRTSVMAQLVHQTWRVGSFQGYDNETNLRLVSPWDAIVADDAQRLASVSRFKDLFGTMFVSGVYKGREIRVEFRAQLNKNVVVNELEQQLALAATYSGVEGGATAEQVKAMTELTQNASVRCTFSFQGDVEDGVQLSTLPIDFSPDNVSEMFKQVLDRYKAYDSAIKDGPVAFRLSPLTYVYRDLDKEALDDRERTLRELFSRLQEVDVQYDAAEFYRQARGIDEATQMVASLEILNEFLELRRNALIDAGELIVLAKTRKEARAVPKPKSEFPIPANYTENQLINAGLLLQNKNVVVPAPNENSLLKELARRYPRRLRITVNYIDPNYTGALFVTLTAFLDGEPVKLFEIKYDGGIQDRTRYFPASTSVVTLKPNWQFLTFDVATRGENGEEARKNTVVNGDDCRVTPSDFRRGMQGDLVISYKSVLGNTYDSSGEFGVKVSAEEM